jgi:hypothetical protein
MTVFANCLSRGRIRFAPRPGRETQRRLRKLVPSNTRDRAVLGAAVGCADRLLVSNDYSDFDHEVREDCHHGLGIQILDTDQALQP